MATSRRFVAPVLLAMALAGCAGPVRERPAMPPPATERQPTRPPGQSAPRAAPGPSLGDPAQVRELVAALTPRGWQLIGPTAVTDAGGEPDLVLAQSDASMPRAGRVSVRLLTLLAGRKVVEEGHAAIVMHAEIDCGRGTIRPLARERYADRLAQQPIGRSELPGSPAVRIAPGMVVAQLQRQVCRR